MAKYRYAIDEKKIERFIKEGRGVGDGANYKPWLTIQDVPSLGLSARPTSHKTQREHHLLSKSEIGAFHLYNWRDDVTDIREQFPLNRSITQRIASEMGIPHPRDPQTQCDIVMTTDFLITINNHNGTRLIARSIKLHSDLERVNVIDKQEIERRYWEQEGIDWGIITDLQIPKQKILNISWAHEFYSFAGLTVPHSGYWEERCSIFLSQLSRRRQITIQEFIQNLELKAGFKPGEGISVIRHLVAHKIILIDMNECMDVQSDLSALQIAPNKSEMINDHAA